MFISFIPLFIISALRGPSVGTDTSNYLRGFRGIRDTHFSYIFELERWEYGYVLLNKFSSFISSSEQVLLAITTFVILIGVMFFIYKNSENVVLSIFLYISLYLYLFSFNVIRQAIAMSILVIGFHFIIRRQFVRYLIVVIVATLFHETAIIMLALYFIYHFRFNFKNVVLISLTFFASFISIDSIINYVLSYSRSLNYLDGASVTKESGFLFPLLNLGILIFVLYIKMTHRVIDQKLDFLLFILMIGLFSSILSMKIYMLLRLNYYFIIYSIIAIPYSLKFVKDKEIRLILIYLLIAIASLYLLFRLYNGWHGISPYRFGTA